MLVWTREFYTKGIQSVPGDFQCYILSVIGKLIIYLMRVMRVKNKEFGAVHSLVKLIVA